MYQQLCVARLLSRDEANFFRRRSVETERSCDRLVHDPAAAHIQSGGKVRVVIEGSEALAGQLDHEGQGGVVQRLRRGDRDSATQ
jgi:hypothetical protein